MVVHGQLVEPAVCLSNLYDVFLLDIVRDTRQNQSLKKNCFLFEGLKVREDLASVSEFVLQRIQI